MVRPVPRDHSPTPAGLRRRRVVAAVTLLAGTALLATALRIEPGDDRFYLASLALAAVWAIGAYCSGPLHLGWAHRRDGGVARPVVQSLVLGTALLLVFLVGALVVAEIEGLRGPVDDLLDHASDGSLLVVALVTLVNGIAEELFFRGALYAAIGRRHAVAITTVVYSLSAIGSGVPLLVFAAGVVGLVVGLQRRVSGGVLGPIITHLVWSLGMLFFLPVALELGG